MHILPCFIYTYLVKLFTTYQKEYQQKIGILCLFLLCTVVCIHSVSWAEKNSDAFLETLLAKERDFNNALENTMPLTPEEISKAKKAREAYENAFAPNPANMQTKIQTVSLPPKGDGCVVNLTQSYSSTLLFQDKAGNPWPVDTLVLGDPSAFSLVHTEEIADGKNSGAHMINIVPLSDRGSSNVAVTLKGCPYPVIVHLVTRSPLLEKRKHDALCVFRIDGIGPATKQKPVEDTSNPSVNPSMVSEDMLAFLHALPNPKAKKKQLDIPGNEIVLWELQEKLYLRSQYPLLWPAWISQTSQEGQRLYVLPKTQSFVVSVAGKSKTVHILPDTLRDKK